MKEIAEKFVGIVIADLNHLEKQIYEILEREGWLDTTREGIIFLVRV